jgi:hypothetical protein
MLLLLTPCQVNGILPIHGGRAGEGGARRREKAGRTGPQGRARSASQPFGVGRARGARLLRRRETTRVWARVREAGFGRTTISTS